MVVRESAPITTPPSNATAMIEVCHEWWTHTPRSTSPFFSRVMSSASMVVEAGVRAADTT